MFSENVSTIYIGIKMKESLYEQKSGYSWLMSIWLMINKIFHFDDGFELSPGDAYISFPKLCHLHPLLHWLHALAHL